MNNEIITVYGKPYKFVKDEEWVSCEGCDLDSPGERVCKLDNAPEWEELKETYGHPVCLKGFTPYVFKELVSEEELSK